MSSPTKSSKLVFKRLKEYDTIWHPDSTLVLKSATEKVAIGRFVDGILINFDEKALALCNKWKFKYDESLINNEGEEEGEEGEEEGEDGEDGEDEGEDGEDGEDDGEDEEEQDIEEQGVEEEEEQVEENKKNDDSTGKVSVPVSVPVQPKNNFKENFTYLNKYIYDLSISVKSSDDSYENEISNLREKLSTKNSEYDSLKRKHDEIEEQYNKLKIKFEGIKSLFS